MEIGKRGEIYTTRKIRERAGLTPGGRVTVSIEQDRLILRPKPTALTLLDKPRIDAPPINPEELSKLRKEITEKLEKR